MAFRYSSIVGDVCSCTATRETGSTNVNGAAVGGPAGFDVFFFCETSKLFSDPALSDTVFFLEKL